MSGASATAPHDPYQLGRGQDETQPRAEHGERTPASKRIIAGYGFWIFLLSDIVMFAAFFATYAVQAGATNGGPSGKDLFDLRNVAIETALLLASSFTCGMASIGAQRRNALWFHGAMAATALLGAAFLALELREFVGLIKQGAGPQRSGFLSAFFTLVGCHGLHVGLGLLWLLTMMAQVLAKGFRADIMRRVLCFGLFWHALDIIWVAVFSVVYLIGAGAMSKDDRAPGDQVAVGDEPSEGVLGYCVGLGLASLLTIVSFVVAGTQLVWAPSIPVALCVLAVAQMGVHLVFFLHINSGPDSTNNVMALAFGVLIVFLVIGGSLWIMAHLNHNMMPMDQIMRMQR